MGTTVLPVYGNKKMGNGLLVLSLSTPTCPCCSRHGEYSCEQNRPLLSQRPGGSSPSRGSGQCKGPEARACLSRSKSSEETRVTGVKCPGRCAGDEARVVAVVVERGSHTRCLEVGLTAFVGGFYMGSEKRS